MQDAHPHTRCVAIALQRDDGDAHPQRLAGGCRTAVRKAVESDIHLVVDRQVAFGRYSPAPQYEPLRINAAPAKPAAQVVSHAMQAKRLRFEQQA